MNDDPTKRVLDRYREQLAAVDTMRDEDIDLSEMPEITDEQWARSRRGKVYQPAIRQVALDADVVDWFTRHHEDGPETAMTVVLREHMERAR